MKKIDKILNQIIKDINNYDSKKVKDWRSHYAQLSNPTAVVLFLACVIVVSLLLVVVANFI